MAISRPEPTPRPVHTGSGPTWDITSARTVALLPDIPAPPSVPAPSVLRPEPQRGLAEPMRDAVPAPSAPWLQTAAAHEQEARFWRAEADQIAAQIAKRSDELAALTSRWDALNGTPRVPGLGITGEMAALNEQIPTIARDVAKLRRRWSASLGCAREQEEMARQSRGSRR